MLVAGCSWFTDFKTQPKIDPWESPADTIPPRGNPQGSVPIYGSAAPGFEFSRMPLPGTIDSMSTIPNPIAADARSLENGRKYFQINCLPCHGPAGRGDGPATRYGMVPMSIITDVTKNRTDGYIFGMIRNGRGLMPTYNRIEETDRWDIVNYLRSLQGKLTTVADTTLVGRPGETGEKVPGATQTAPTRPSPYFKLVGSQAGIRELMPDTATRSAMPAAQPQPTPATGAPAAAATPAPGRTPARPPRDTTKRNDTTKKGVTP